MSGITCNSEGVKNSVNKKESKAKIKSIKK